MTSSTLVPHQHIRHTACRPQLPQFLRSGPQPRKANCRWPAPNTRSPAVLRCDGGRDLQPPARARQAEDAAPAAGQGPIRPVRPAGVAPDPRRRPVHLAPFLPAPLPLSTSSRLNPLEAAAPPASPLTSVPVHAACCRMTGGSWQRSRPRRSSPGSQSATGSGSVATPRPMGRPAGRRSPSNLPGARTARGSRARSGPPNPGRAGWPKWSSSGGWARRPRPWSAQTAQPPRTASRCTSTGRSLECCGCSRHRSTRWSHTGWRPIRARARRAGARPAAGRVVAGGGAGAEGRPSPASRLGA